MPTFNDFIGGQSINRGGRWSKSTSKGDYIGPILRSQSVNIEEAEVHMLDGTFLGKISQLKAFA
jgi:tRNA U55 pseudouridine synthase TruB